MRFFATAAKGTEPALRDELRELRFRRVRADRGGVHFEGEMADAARACIWSRIAVRVLLEVATFAAGDEKELYDRVRTVEWSAWMTPRTTLSVRASCRSSRLTHSQFIAQKTKDAIVDTLRDRLGARPSVDRSDPDVGVALHLANDAASLYLDVSGSSLHERGFRVQSGPAPLRETLAAAVLRLSGWGRDVPLSDPMCGAGTLAIEAAAWAGRRAPGLSRARFGFERWANYDAALRTEVNGLRNDARDAALPHVGPFGRDGSAHGPVVRASDIDPAAVEWTRQNAKVAGVNVVVERRDVRDFSPAQPREFIVTNPPYGQRIEVDRAFFVEVAHAFRQMRGHSISMLAGTPEIGRAMRQPPDRWWTLFNGPIECRLLVYDPRAES